MANPFGGVGQAMGGGVGPSQSMMRQKFQMNPGQGNAFGRMRGMMNPGMRKPMMGANQGQKPMVNNINDNYGKQMTGSPMGPSPQMMNWLQNAPNSKDSLGQPQIIPDEQKQNWLNQMPPGLMNGGRVQGGYVGPDIARGGIMGPGGPVMPQNPVPEEAPEEVMGVEEQRQRQNQGGGMSPSPNFMNRMQTMY